MAEKKRDIFADDPDDGNDILQDKIKQYREMLKKEKPELDIELLFRILRIMNDASEVHVAIDPIAEDGQWTSSAPTYAVSGVTELNDGRVALRVNNEKQGMSVENLEKKLRKALGRDRGTGKPVLFVRGDAVTQLTDAYSHALVREKWAGLPFDLVLAIKTEKKPEAEDEKK